MMVTMNSDFEANLDLCSPITVAQYKYIVKTGVLTGSRAYGGHTEDSDYDYLLEASNININEYNHYYENSRYNTEYFRSLYIKTKGGKLLNVLVFDNTQAYKLWRKSTRILVFLSKFALFQKLLNNRDCRIILFEAMLSALDTYYGYSLIVVHNESKYNNDPSSIDYEDIPF